MAPLHDRQIKIQQKERYIIMKTLGLSLLLLTAVSAISASKIEYDLTVNGQETKGVYEFDGATFDVADEFAEHFFKAHVQAEEEGIVIDLEVTKHNDANEATVVSTQVVRLAWEQEAEVTLSDANEQSLKLVVHAHK
jgi:hypothetical protein